MRRPTRLNALGACLLLALAAAAGCGQGEEPASEAKARAPAAPEPSKAPVAYELPRDAARKLTSGDAWAVIEREGRVVARSEWDPFTAVVLAEWLEDRGIRLGHVASDPELPLLVIGSEHRGLTRLHPTADRLGSFYKRFTQEKSAEAGQAMLDWLRVFRRAGASADATHLVVIPVLE